MFQNVLSKLSFDQIIELSDLPHPLISYSTADSNEDRLSAFAKFITGQTTWDSIINIKLKEKSYFEAFTFFVQSQQHRSTISKTIKNDLSVCLTTIEQIISDKKSAILISLEKIDKRALEALNYANNLKKDLIKINFLFDIPTTISEVENLKSLFNKVSDLEHDCNDILDIADKELSTNVANFHDLVEKSFDRFFNLLKKDKLIEGAHETDIFRQLPSIVINKDTDLLSKLADNNESIHDIEIFKPDKKNIVRKKAIRSISNFHVKSENLSSLPITLNRYSQVIYDSYSMLVNIRPSTSS
jgi:hypothetical protein